MYGIAGFGFRTIEEQIDSAYMSVLKPDLVQSGLHIFEIGPAHEDIDILGIANGGFIDPAHPGGHGIAPDDGVGDIGLFQGVGSAQQPFADFSTALTIRSRENGPRTI